MSHIKQLYTGTAWNLLKPDPAKVYMQDIMKSLSRINRYNGHSRINVSVLWHSLLVESIAEGEAKPYARLHDVHEAYLGDMVSPVKRALAAVLPAGQFKAAWDKLTFEHDEAIWQAFGLPVPSGKILAEVNRADMVALATEREYFIVESDCPWGDLPEPVWRAAFSHLPDLDDGFLAMFKFSCRVGELGMMRPPDRPGIQRNQRAVVRQAQMYSELTNEHLSVAASAAHKPRQCVNGRLPGRENEKQASEWQRKGNQNHENRT